MEGAGSKPGLVEPDKF